MEHEGLAGQYPDTTPTRTRREDHSDTARRERRATCSSRPDPYAIWTDYGDVKGPFTTDPADYRIRRQLVVLMQFADHTSRSVPSRDFMDSLMNCRGGSGCVFGDSTSGVRDYFLHQSYYRADTISTVTDWVTISQTETYTSGPGQYGKNTRTALSRLCGAMQEALQLTLAANPTLDLNDFVHDCDHRNQSLRSYSEMKEVLFIHSGYPAEFSSSASANRIWSHRFQFGSLGCSANSVNEYTNPADGAPVRMPYYLVTNGCYGDGSDGDACPPPRLGVIAHEMGHSLLHGKSVADFYEVYDGQTTLPERCGSSGAGKGIDAWGLMGDSWGACGDQKYPPGMTAWSKMEMGWLNPIEVRTGTAQTFDLYRAAQCPSALRVNYNYGSNFGSSNASVSTEFLVVEFRQKVGHDSGLPGEGVVVYHLDLATGTGGANRRPSWSTDPLAHYYFRMEQGDGSDGLECGTDADGGDVYTVGTSITAKQIQSSPYQSTRGYQSSTEIDTGITLRVASTALSGAALRVQYTTTTDSVPNNTVATAYTTTCGAGQYGKLDGTCASCPVGKYSSDGSPCISGCQICPDGTYTDSTGSSSCTPCPSGTYDDVGYYPSNSSSCKTCPSTTSIDAFGVIPLKHLAFEYCRNGGSFSSYEGGSYATYTQWGVDCGTWTFLGLTKEQWLFLMYAAVVFVVLLIVVSQCWHIHTRRRRKRIAKQHRDMIKGKPRQIRAGHGYATYAPQQQVPKGGAAPPPRYDAQGKKLTPEQLEKLARMREIELKQRGKEMRHVHGQQALTQDDSNRLRKGNPRGVRVHPHNTPHAGNGNYTADNSRVGGVSLTHNEGAHAHIQGTSGHQPHPGYPGHIHQPHDAHPSGHHGHVGHHEHHTQPHVSRHNHSAQPALRHAQPQQGHTGHGQQARREPGHGPHHDHSHTERIGQVGLGQQNNRAPQQGRQAHQLQILTDRHLQQQSSM